VFGLYQESLASSSLHQQQQQRQQQQQQQQCNNTAIQFIDGSWYPGKG
jgi:hypothetical protein